MQTIFPILRYNDARAAIRWLCETFGFELRISIPEDGEFVRHAQLSLGSNIVMIGSSRNDGIDSPQTVGRSTQALCVFIPDVDKHFKKVQMRNVEITTPLYVTDFGAREFHVRDPEGHLWIFSSFNPNEGAA